MKQFVTEVANIDQLRHRNVVQLLGYCSRKGELLLVYDYMHNGGGGARVAGSSGVAQQSRRCGGRSPWLRRRSKRLGNEELAKERDVLENECQLFRRQEKVTPRARLLPRAFVWFEERGLTHWRVFLDLR
jgi:hypothetical protein